MSINFDSKLICDVGLRIAAAGVRSIRRAAAGDEIPKKVLAVRLGMHRQTLSTRLSRGDMKLSEFVSAALAVGERPSDLLATAEDAADLPALADKEVK
ncbi:hypothetical protein D2E23_0411 [Bifidobacterium callimiconis]|uniref:XRE family transcriptional regulator n=1 Tax=Bifidobacterium callimiconis TaxID=2306973 RepID=A0A430FIG9_9BIFI|nr:hypothetical protein D2E23_0411 [Bifidobacterium callimiconis]